MTDGKRYKCRPESGENQQGGRPDDPVPAVFLDGSLVKSQRLQFLATFEPVYQIWIDGWYLYDRVETAATGTITKNGTFGLRARTAF